MRPALLLLAVVGSSPILLAQSALPAPEHALIIGARAVRQATTQSPLELTLPSGTRVTISPQDVHGAATTWARGKLMEQSSRSVNPSLLFVLHIRPLATPGKRHTDVTLFSGAVVRVASDDLRDFRLLFLRTALAQAVAGQRARPPVSADGITPRSASDSSSPPSVGGGGGTGVRSDVPDFCCPAYIRTMAANIRKNWNVDQTVAGTVEVKFTILRDGTLTAIEVERTSGMHLLDLESLQAVARTGPLPPLPREFAGPTLTIYLTFEYHR